MGVYFSYNDGSGAQVSGGSPLTLPLVTSSSPILTFKGTFNGPADGNFQYGGGALGLSGNSLGVLGNMYVNGLQQNQALMGKMTIPAPTGGGGSYTGAETATTLVNPNTHSLATAFGDLGSTPGSWPAPTGSLEYGGNLYMTGATVYDANVDQSKFLMIGTTSVTGFGTTYGANGTSGGGARLFSGGMNLVPAIWQPLLGGPAYVFSGPGGGSGLSINSNLPNGPGFSTFDPATIVGAGHVNLKEWINYPYSNPDGRFTGALSGYFQTTQANWPTWGDDLCTQYDGPIGVAWIHPGSRSLLFLHHHVYGPVETGAGTDPCNSGASGAWDNPVTPDTQSYRRFQIEAYDLAAVLTANPNGTSASAPRPYAWWQFPSWQTLWGSAGSCNNNFDCTGREVLGFGTVDYANNILYVSMGWPGINGTMYVFKLNSL